MANPQKDAFKSGVYGTRGQPRRTPAATGGGGVTDHGALTGLGDDDHTQYHNDTRGDARYYTQAQVNTSLSGKSDTGHTHAQADVTNLTTDLAGKASTVHTHAGADITSGTVAIARLPTGTSGTTVALGDHLHSGQTITPDTVDVGAGGVHITDNGALESALTAKLSLDTQPRLRVQAGGEIAWGPGGSTAVDTNLYRSGANTLKTDDSLEVVGGLAVTGSATFTVPAHFTGGQPVSLTTSWGNANHPEATYGRRRAWIDPAGTVHLCGMFTIPNPKPADANVIATIPLGYRPAYRLLMIGSAGGTGGAGVAVRIDIMVNGEIRWYANSSAAIAGEFLNLTGMTFPVAASGIQ